MARGYTKGDALFGNGQSWAYDDDFNAIRAKFSTKNYEVTAKDGKKLIYKCHVVLEEANFYDGPGAFPNDSTREIMAQFLHDNDFPHKTAPKIMKEKVLGAHGLWNIFDASSPQVGKTFTVYFPTLEHFYIIVKGTKELISKYSLNGIDRRFFEMKGANLQYEYPVPETNNIIYYTLERIDGTVIGYADRKDKMNEYFGEGPLDFLFPKLNPKGEAFW